MAKQYNTDQRAFQQQARLWTQTYARKTGPQDEAVRCPASCSALGLASAARCDTLPSAMLLHIRAQVLHSNRECHDDLLKCFPWQLQVKRLTEMGFDARAAVTALQVSGGDENAALEALLGS